VCDCKGSQKRAQTTVIHPCFPILDFEIHRDDVLRELARKLDSGQVGGMIRVGPAYALARSTTAEMKPVLASVYASRSSRKRLASSYLSRAYSRAVSGCSIR
jgi:hypothetical protein